MDSLTRNFAGDPDNDYVLQNCKVISIPNKFLPWNSCKREFVGLLRKIKPNVFHANGCWAPLCALTLLWAAEMGIKTVLTPHGMLDPYAVRHNYWTKKLPAILLYQRRAVSRVTCIHCTSLMEKNNVQRLKWNENIQIIPNCVQMDNIQMKNSWRRTNRLVFISRIHHKKGLHFLIDAAYDMREELKGYQILIAGPKENSYYDEMVKKCNDLEVSDIVQFVGPVYGEEKWKMYREADVFILPTITENFGIVIAEALASGTPVITTDGAPWEDLNVYNCGWWIKIGKEPLKTALRSYMDTTVTQLETMGKNGRKLICDKYSSQSVARQFMEMYQNL